MPTGTNPQQDDDDYDVIIEESGIGDPTVGVSLSFGGSKAPSKNAPWTDVNIKFAVLWKTPNTRIDIGEVTVQKVHRPDPYRFAIPYDALAFDFQVEKGVPLDLLLIIKAKDAKGRKIKLAGGQPTGDGYLYVAKDIVPEIYKDSYNIVKSQE